MALKRAGLGGRVEKFIHVHCFASRYTVTKGVNSVRKTGITRKKMFLNMAKDKKILTSCSNWFKNRFKRVKKSLKWR